MTIAFLESGSAFVRTVAAPRRRRDFRAARGVVRCSKEEGDAIDARESFLDNAALDFAKGIEAGMKADEIVLLQMGVEREDELTEVQRRYRDKFIEKLRKRAAEMKTKSKECAAFEAGKAAYGRGAYPTCCQLLEEAALDHPETSLLGGDIRMWLALAYQALGKTEECVALFKRLQDYHPIKKTRQQAKELLFIIEAPRLEVREDERVKLPVLKDMDRAPARSGTYRVRSRPPKRSDPERRQKSFEESFWENYRPPVYIRNRYVQAAFLAICLSLACYSFLSRSGSGSL